LVAIGVVGDVTRSAKGFPARIEGDAWRALDWPEEWVIDPACKAAVQPKGIYCQQDARSAASHVLLGDSHANHFFPGLAPRVARSGGALLQIQGPLQMAGDDNWANVDWVIGRPEIRTVFVAYHHGRIHEKDNPFAGVTEKMLAQLFAAGKKVVFLVDNPEFDFDPRLCTDRPAIARWLGAGNNAAQRCGESVEFMRRKRVDYEHYLASLAASYPELQFFDTFTALCDDKQCSAIDGKNLLFRDRHHLTQRGSERVFSGFELPLPRP
jgi:hypothetical protein